MPVRFVLGRAGAGKTHHCLSGIRAELKDTPLGPALILLVPEQAAAQMERPIPSLLRPATGEVHHQLHRLILIILGPEPRQMELHNPADFGEQPRAGYRPIDAGDTEVESAL